MTKQQPRGQPFDTERGRLAGQQSKKHGLFALRDRGEAALDAEGILTLREIEESLTTPEGIVSAMRKRVAMSLMVLGVLESYLEERVNAGATPEGIDIFKSWPAFQNSAMRALAQLLGTMPKAQHDTLAEEVKAIQDLVREHQETVVQDDVEMQQRAMTTSKLTETAPSPPGVNGSDREGDHA